MIKTSGDRLEVREVSSSDEGSQSGTASSVEEEEPQNDKMAVEEQPAGKTVTFRNPPKLRTKKKVRKLTKQQLRDKTKMKLEKEKMGLVKPDITKDRTREHELRRIATIGVAQLFNAVNERQKKIDNEIVKQKGVIKDKSALRAGLDVNIPNSTKPKKEEVEEWLNDAADTSIVKEEEIDEEYF